MAVLRDFATVAPRFMARISNKSEFQKDIKAARPCSPRRPYILDPLRFLTYERTAVLSSRAVFAHTVATPSRCAKRIINTCTSMRNRSDCAHTVQLDGNRLEKYTIPGLKNRIRTETFENR